MASSVQVLVATMHREVDDDLLVQMNINSQAIIGNQRPGSKAPESIEYAKFRDNDIVWLNFNTKGVGKNRNEALMRATADIIIFADDDMKFVDGYEQTVLKIFNENPQADVIIFNLIEKKVTRQVTKRKHFTKKIGYGAARIACRRHAIFKHGVFFNLCFGGGTEHSCGEDTMFLSDCIKKKLKILLVPNAIAELNEDRASTWFIGYNEKYYHDLGYLLAAAKVSFLHLRIIKACLFTKVSFKEKIKIYNSYLDGVRDYKRRGE